MSQYVPQTGRNMQWDYFDISVPRQEVVLPYLHKLDEFALHKGTDDFFVSYSNLYDRVVKLTMNMALSTDQLKNIVNTMMKAYKENDVPGSFVNDLFNFYYHPIEKLEFEEYSHSNHIFFKMLERLNHPTLKILCYHHPLKTMLLVRTLLMNFLFAYALRKLENNPAADELMSALKQVGCCDAQSTAGNGTCQAAPGQPTDDPAEENDQADHDEDSEGDNNLEGEQSEESGGQDGDQHSGNPTHETSGNTSPPANSQNGTADQQGGAAPQNNQSAQNSSGSSSGSSQQLDAILDQIINGPDAKQFAEMSFNDVRQFLANVDEMMPANEQADLWKDLGKNKHGSSLDELCPERIEKQVSRLQELRMNMGGVKHHIKHLLDRSINNLSAREEVRLRNILDADTWDSIQNIELLHPKYKHLFLEELNVRDRRKVGRIDVYLDISTSMNEGSGIRTDYGKPIPKLQFAKAMVLKLQEMDMLDDLYLFNDWVSKVSTRLANIVTITSSGGTKINKVIQAVSKTAKNSIVITDAEDACKLHHPQAFFIGVAGAKFNSFEPAVLETYVENNQLCLFDGSQVYQIGSDGLPITG